MRAIDADALDDILADGEIKARKNRKYVLESAINTIRGNLAQLPSIPPERKRGKWIAVTEDGDVYKRICSCCRREAFFQNDDPDELYDGGRYELSDFCPHCGAEMSKK